jgi:tetratricopeptide (TPR) repeat protein
LSIDPDDIQAFINKGRSSQLHRIEEAISNYNKALIIELQNADALVNKGLSLYNLGKILRKLHISIRY